MPFSIEDKLVVGIASSALFDLSESHRVWTETPDEYHAYQRRMETTPLAPGVAFPFIRRILSLNVYDADRSPVEVILVSRNDSDTGLRVMNSIEHHGLTISRAVFLRGSPPYPYLPALNCSLFLTANAEDVRKAIMSGSPAGVVLDSEFEDDHNDHELRIAFDFDGVLASDEAERIYQNTDLSGFHESERQNATVALDPGPLKPLLEKVRDLQQRERELQQTDPQYKPMVKTAIITARNAPAHARLMHTLREWGIVVDATFLLGGMAKTKILEVFRPHIFFDDQKVHLDTASGLVPSVHIPFGIMNERDWLKESNDSRQTDN